GRVCDRRDRFGRPGHRRSGRLTCVDPSAHLFGQDLYPGLGGDSGSLVGPWRAGHPVTNHRADGPGRMRGVVSDAPYGHGVLLAFVSQAQVTDTVCAARAEHDVVT